MNAKSNKILSVSGIWTLLKGIIILAIGVLIINSLISHKLELTGIILIIVVFIGVTICAFGILMILWGIYRLLGYAKKDEIWIKKQEERKQKAIIIEENYKKAYNSNIKNYETLYGVKSTEIQIGFNGSKYDIKNYVLVYEDSSHIIIRDVVYKFSDIISCELTNNSSIIYNTVESQTKTSTGNMLGRAVVGGVLLGGAGAIIGGATANKKTITNEQIAETRNDFNIHLTVNSITNPNITIRTGEDEYLARDLVSLLSVIIERNK